MIISSSVQSNSVQFLSVSLEDWTRLVQITAIIVGGIAAYIKWFRGRLYRTRLEVGVSGAVVVASPPQLLVTARAKNVGLSRAMIRQKGSVLRVSSVLATGPSSGMLSVEWKHEASFAVFLEHEWIESNETIESQMLVTLPDGQPGTYRLELVLGSGKNAWKASGIVSPMKEIINERKGN